MSWDDRQRIDAAE